jgi:hypothetical protein
MIGSHQCRSGRWSHRGAGWKIFPTELPSVSARREREHAQSGLCSERATPRRRRNQQRASKHQRKEADSVQRQLLETCKEINSRCINGSIKTTNHKTIVEQLRLWAERFRKQGRLSNEDLEEIITDIKASDGSTEANADKVASSTSDDKTNASWRQWRRDSCRSMALPPTQNNKEYSGY